MTTIHPAASADQPQEREVDTSWKISNNPPGISLGLQSQFAHLQLTQSKVCKEKAEESIRQVQDSQEKQRASRIYASEAQRLLEKAKRDGKTDVNKELEAFCLKNGIPFKKLDIQKGTVSIMDMIMSAFFPLATGGLALLALAHLGITPKNVLTALGKIATLGIALAEQLRAFLPKDLQLILDGVISVLRLIQGLLDPQNTRSKDQHMKDLAQLGQSFQEKPFTGAQMDQLFDIGVREGVLTVENVRKTATDMNIDLDETISSLTSFARSMASDTAGDTSWWELELDEGLAKILMAPLVLMNMLMHLIEGKPTSFEEAFKEVYHKTKIGEVCDAEGWKAVLDNLEALNAHEAGRSQLLMVNINNQIGQYNSYLQGAMTAIANATQVNTALAKGTG